MTPNGWRSKFVEGTQRLLKVAGISRLPITEVSYEISVQNNSHVGFINFSKTPNISFDSPQFPDNLTSIEMPESLFQHLFVEKKNWKGFSNLHWNQADGGSHFTYRRTGAFDAHSSHLLSWIGS